MKLVSSNLAETKKFAGEFLEKIKAAAQPAAGGARVIGLYGDLGSGKTTFVQYVAEILGVKEHTTSPTFLIMKKYQIPSTKSQTNHKFQAQKFQTLIHADAYRLKSGEELRKLGFEDLLRDPKNLILIEWADKVADLLPKDHVKIFFEFINDTTRKISFSS